MICRPAYCELESESYLFADDAKLFKHIINQLDNIKLQSSINALQEWSDRWMLKLNLSKCKIVSFGREVNNDYMYSINVNQQSIQLARESKITDL